MFNPASARSGGVGTTFTVPGTFPPADTDAFASHVASVAARPGGVLVVDLSQADRLDSRVLAMLVAGTRR